MELENRIETIIFLSKEKLSVDELANHFKIDKQKMIETIERLIEMRKGRKGEIEWIKGKKEKLFSRVVNWQNKTYC